MKGKLLAEQKELVARVGKNARKDHGDFQADFPEYGRSEEENADEVSDFIANNAVTEAEERRLEQIEVETVPDSDRSRDLKPVRDGFSEFFRQMSELRALCDERDNLVVDRDFAKSRSWHGAFRWCSRAIAELDCRIAALRRRWGIRS